MSQDKPVTAVVVGDHHEVMYGAPPLPARTDFFELDIEQQIARATIFANALKKIVDSQNLAVKFGNNQEYLPVEVWQTLGSFLGVTPREKEVKKHEDGSFEAQVDLVRLATGMIIGSGSGLCGMDEPNWKTKPAFSRRSMAITRGTGKAYRTAFSWIMVLAGYAPTPAEEMPVDANKEKEPQSAPSKEDKSVKYLGTIEEQEGLSKWIAEQHPEIPEAKYFEIHSALKGQPKKNITKIIKEVAHV